MLWTDLTERSPSTEQNGVEKPGHSLTEQGTRGLLRRCTCSGCSEVNRPVHMACTSTDGLQAAGRGDTVVAPCGAGPSEVRSRFFCCSLSDDQEQGREATSLLLEVGCGGLSDEMEGE